MTINWYYFSDTNSPPGEIKTFLHKLDASFTSVTQVESLHKKLAENEHSVLFIRSNPVLNGYDLCQEVSILHPSVYIVLIVPDNMENLKKAMHMGASDILRYSYTFEKMRETILRAKRYMEFRSNKETHNTFKLINGDSRVITVCNPKGGIGRTMLTVNLAASFAKRGKRVAIIDANLQFGEVTMFLNIKTKRTIYEWVKEAYGREELTIDQYMATHESGVSVLAAPLRPEFFEGITETHVRAAIEEVKQYYDVVLIDTPAFISDIHLSCLDLSDEILLVTINDLSVMRISKLYLETLETIRQREKVKVILNKQGKNKSLDLKKIEEILTSEIYSVIPEQDSVSNSSISTGQPFIISNPRSHIGKAVWQLTEKMLAPADGSTSADKRGKRWFLAAK
ncbi:hypothetical protein DYI25_19340 [Mesobacillus boroniphilus]|uniref:AAA domain-containing protein n=1 Tax=Mesobacillus boroniphilus TaxID=308892 RepID=A0A944CQ17_9BACI|nr:AAA family ATPase [Mesobacillus boroniphilus]MBS8266581.1 hypothetical protein [Mesobacillus boroniphilus]